MSEVERGNLFGTFTWRRSNVGKNAIMPWDKWKHTIAVLLEWQYVLHRAKLMLDGVVTSADIENLRHLISSAVDVQIDENGPIDRREGFTLVETMIAVVIVAFLALAAFSMFNPQGETRLVACAANIKAMQAIVEQAAEQSWPYTPTIGDVLEVADGRWDDNYVYVPNMEDTNNGHGNDLDLCDSGNPGKSSLNRNCLEIKYLIICKHDHGELANYVCIAHTYDVRIVGGDPRAPLTRDLKRWEWDDPHFERYR